MIKQMQQMLNHGVLVLRIVCKSEMIKISQLPIWYHCQTEISDTLLTLSVTLCHESQTFVYKTGVIFTFTLLNIL